MAGGPLTQLTIGESKLSSLSTSLYQLVRARVCVNALFFYTFRPFVAIEARLCIERMNEQKIYAIFHVSGRITTKVHVIKLIV